MGVIANRRSIMALFSRDGDIYSHQSRYVMAEKGINAEIVSVPFGEDNEELKELNPYNSLPTLIDRELTLYGPGVILEYLDERFPHPPLMPVDPVSRANVRLMVYRVDVDLYQRHHAILVSNSERADVLRQELLQILLEMVPVFAQKPFFMNDDYTMIDAVLLPFLWRLPHLGIELPKQAEPLSDYCERMFMRKGFVRSLTEEDLELRN
ncbi:MAG: glutathione S-transferase N-terminal domain-containing protein [Gammaproteobacteria bacterium]|nr:glutathione S-transferase N-terminal domain-containing protein [Gammaproteobacteria bacterium]